MTVEFDLLSWSSKLSCQALETMPGICVSYRFVGQPSYLHPPGDNPTAVPSKCSKNLSAVLQCRIYIEEENILVYYLTQIIFPVFVKSKSFVYVYALLKKKANLKSRVPRQESTTISVPGKCCPEHTGTVSPRPEMLFRPPSLAVTISQFEQDVLHIHCSYHEMLCRASCF